MSESKQSKARRSVRRIAVCAARKSGESYAVIDHGHGSDRNYDTRYDVIPRSSVTSLCDVIMIAEPDGVYTCMAPNRTDPESTDESETGSEGE